MFDNILGNDKIKQMLINSVKEQKVSHSYLFIGTEGIGKKMIALEYAEMLLNRKKENNPDFKIIEPDGNSLKIEQIRDMQNEIAEKPVVCDKKIYIINDGDKMTVEAQNCLLKTLEEPPEYVIIILIGANENSFLNTIKSRCMIVRFEKLSNDQIKYYFKKNYNQEFDDDSIINIFQGSIVKAIKLKEKQEEYKKIEKLICNLNNKSIIDIINDAEVIYKSKENKEEMLDYINIVLYDLAKKDYKYAYSIKIVEETKKRLKVNSNFDMCIDNMLFGLWKLAK